MDESERWIAKITPNGAYEETIECTSDQLCWASNVLVNNGTAPGEESFALMIGWIFDFSITKEEETGHEGN